MPVTYTNATLIRETQHFPHRSFPPPFLFSRFQTTFPAHRCTGRLCTTYSLRQKNAFAKSVWANSPLCSPAVKKLSKVLCSFAIVFLFKYDLWFEYIFRKIFQPVFVPKDVLFCSVQKMIFAVVARAARMRSAGAQHTWVPMRPPETYTFSCARTLSSNTVLYCFFMPTGLQPPRT